jgi:hypothetical protein
MRRRSGSGITFVDHDLYAIASLAWLTLDDSQTSAPQGGGAFLASDTSSPRSNAFRSVVGEREYRSTRNATTAERL